MKFFHLGDLHIGKQLHHYSLIEDQEYALRQVLNVAEKEKPDAVLLTGDIYDKTVPSAEAIHLLDAFLSALSFLETPPVILMIAGNHDSGERLSFANEILKKNQVYIAGMPPKGKEERIEKVCLKDAYGEVYFYLLPFTKPAYLRQGYSTEEIDSYEKAVEILLEKEQIDSRVRNVILSHQFYIQKGSETITCDSETHMVGGIDEVDAEKLKVFDYAALGHIHRAQKIGKETCRYAGTLLKYSISEKAQEKTFTIVEMQEKGKPLTIRQVPIEPLRDVKVLRGTLQEVLKRQDAKEDYVSIVLTDEIEPYLPKERLEMEFTHILEIRIDNERTRKILEFEEEEIPKEAPIDSFASFFQKMQGRDMTAQEQAVIEAVFNQLLEKGAE